MISNNNATYTQVVAEVSPEYIHSFVLRIGVMPSISNVALTVDKQEGMQIMIRALGNSMALPNQDNLGGLETGDNGYREG